MKASSSPGATPLVFSHPLNTPSGLGSSDYFVASHALEDAQSINKLQINGVFETEETFISDLYRQQNASIPSVTDILPNELLCLILELGYFDFGEGSVPLCPDAHFRSSMLQTSHKLRQLVLNTPSLWSIIHLTPGNVEHELDHLPQYIERSAQYPLDIHLSCFWEAYITESVLGHLIPHSKRWRKLSVVTVNSYSLSLLQNIPVPILEDLEVSFFSHDRRIALPSTFLDKEMPRLVHLCLRNIDLDALHVPFHDLRTLEIRGYGTWPTIRRLREMLESSANLEKLILHVKPSQAIQEMQIEEERRNSQVILAALRTFEVYTSEWLSSRIVTLLRIFTCPKLEAFVLREGVGSASETSRTIMSYTSTPHRHKESNLYNRLGAELCTGNPNRMFVQAASVSAACETLSLSTLTSLELRKPIFPHISTAKATFSELKNLKYLYFLDMDSNASICRLLNILGTISDEDTSLADMASEIVIPSLETLVLEISQSQNSNFSTDYTAEFMDIFHLPSLRSLTLKNVKPYSLKKITSSFSRQIDIYTQLISLQLIDIKDIVPMDPGAQLALSFPRLRRLALDCVSSNPFIHQLCPLSSGPHSGTLPWPEMEELSVCNDRHVSKPLLHRVISERVKMGKPLLKLHLDHQFSSNQDSWDWLKEHIEVGHARSGFL